MIETLGNLGEFIGSIGVLVTLIYLAIQVKQNTGAAQIERGNNARLEFTELTTGNERYIKLLLAASSRTEHNPEDHAHMVERFFTIMFTLQNVHYRDRSGYDDLDTSGFVIQITKWALSTEITRSLWPIIRSDFSDEFQSLVDTEVFSPNSSSSSFTEAFSLLEGRTYSDDA